MKLLPILIVVGLQTMISLGSSPIADKENENMFSWLKEDPGSPETLGAYRGPQDETNWVVLNQLLMGAYPYYVSYEDDDSSILDNALTLDIRVFVCLDSYGKINPNRTRYRAPYRRLANKKIRPDKIELIKFPIKDQSTVPDEEIRGLTFKICEMLCEGRKIYIHCWGGHGRAGTVAAIVLGMLHNFNGEESLRRIQLLHHQRADHLDAQCPQSRAQKAQVIRVLEAWQILYSGRKFHEVFLEEHTPV